MCCFMICGWGVFFCVGLVVGWGVGGGVVGCGVCGGVCFILCVCVGGEDVCRQGMYVMEWCESVHKGGACEWWCVCVGGGCGTHLEN